MVSVSHVPIRVLALLLVGAACSALSAQQNTAPAATAVGNVTPDPDLILGSLENGMRYQLRRNGTPAGQIALRLRVQAGSLNENDDERGIAHLLEHMAFRGSKHFADGEAWKELQRLGLKNGADANAATTLGTTIYQIDLPTGDAKSLQTALTMLRDFASEQTLTPAALDSERSIVQAEARVRANPMARVAESSMAFQFQGRRLGDRSPIGKPEVIASATPDTLRRFYHAWYRPERTVLIAVGDIDPAAFAREIEKHFGDWKGAGKAGVEPDPGSSANRGFAAHVFSEPDVPRAIAVDWIAASPSGPETKAMDRDAAVRDIGLLALSRRLTTVVQSPNAPFHAASATYVPIVGGMEHIVTIGADYDGDDWRRALRAIEAVRRGALEQGLVQVEVDEAVQLIARVLQQQADSVHPNAEIAARLLRSLDRDSVPQSPAQVLAEFKSDTVGLTAAEVTGALKKAFSGGGPLVILSTPIAATEEMLAQEFQQAQSAPTATQSVAQKPVWPYTSFGPRGQVEDRQYVQDLDVVLVRFANGVRLNIKPTKLQPNQVGVWVSVGDGRLELPKDHPSAIWVAMTGGYLNGGVVGIDPPTMARALSDKLFKLGFSMGDASFVITGETRPSDIDTQLQVIAAYVKAPAFRVQGFDLARRNMLAQIERFSSAPIGTFGVNINGLLHAGDPRWAFPRAADVQATKPGDLQALIGNALAFGPIEVTLVGDIEPDRAIDSVAATFGALGRRSSQTMTPDAADRRFPGGNKEPFVLEHQGRDDQGYAAIAWPTTDGTTHAQVAPALQLLCDVVQLRLAEQLRVASGESYTAECGSNTASLIPDYGFLMASADIRPTHTQVFFQTMDKIAADLRSHAPSPDEMQRVQKAEVEKLKQAQQTNSFWLGALVRVQRDPKRLDQIRNLLPNLEAVKPADVQHAAAAYLLDDKAYRVVVRKAPTAQAP